MFEKYPSLSSLYSIDGEPHSRPDFSGAVPYRVVGLKYAWLRPLSVVWLLGSLALCLYALISYLRLKRRVSTAIWTEGGLWETDKIEGPFVLGFFPPKIYLPLGFSGATRDYVVLHERAHIRRGDHFVKAVAFLALALHWFNPLLWLAWALLCRDMESACDESLLKNYPLDGRKRYSTALLTLASVKPVGVPLAFGENNVKSRIKDVLKEKRPGKWLITCCVLLTLLTGYALSTNPTPLPQEAPALSWEQGALRHQAAVDATSWENLPTIIPPASGEVHLFFKGYPEEVSAWVYPKESDTDIRQIKVTRPGAPVIFLTLPGGWSDGSVLVLTARWRSGINTAEYTYAFRLAVPAYGADGTLSAPVAFAGGQQLQMHEGRDFSSLDVSALVSAPVGSYLEIAHPGDKDTLTQYTESFYTLIDGKPASGGPNGGGSGGGGSSGTRLGKSDVGTFGLLLTYTYADGTTTDYCAIFNCVDTAPAIAPPSP